jgi:SRSO17 transposase
MPGELELGADSECAAVAADAEAGEVEVEMMPVVTEQGLRAATTSALHAGI